MSDRSITSRFGALWDALSNAFSRPPRAAHAPRPTQPLNPRQFQDTAVGSGIFGRWIIDRAGLPAYAMISINIAIIAPAIPTAKTSIAAITGIKSATIA